MIPLFQKAKTSEIESVGDIVKILMIMSKVGISATGATKVVLNWGWGSLGLSTGSANDGYFVSPREPLFLTPNGCCISDRISLM